MLEVFFCQPIQIDDIIWLVEDDGRITFLTTDNENGVLTCVGNGGIYNRFVHTELEIKIQKLSGYDG